MNSSGILLINKEKGWTSFDVVKKARKLLKTKKIGHIGTLDPFATGLLILLIGKATRICEYVVELDKEYTVKSRFGIATDTSDITGKVIAEEQPKIVTQTDFENKIPTIEKITSQIPSKYSAIKINGKKAYDLARKGVEFEMAEKKISIKKFELLRFNFPEFEWRIVVSKGTYIRTLTEQIADYFDNIATTIELERTKIGSFKIENSISINDVSESTELLPLLDLIPDMPKVYLQDAQLTHFVTGLFQEIEVSGEDNELFAVPKSPVCVLSCQNVFLGIGLTSREEGKQTITLRPHKV
ncbi:MAG: tRNA pseudouridine(55) synthase TruB, partial [Candidatus Cloacimonetes bacterium]|nr:tRNA pseudouridine(55) synthase TruB [Candidatus Cloacimonadota bacterium]